MRRLALLIPFILPAALPAQGALDAPGRAAPESAAAVPPVPSAPSAPAARPVVPSFRSLRFDERWGATSPGLKHLPLAHDDRVFLTIGGQLRARGERVSHYLSEVEATHSDGYGGTRLLLSADLWITTHARLFVEGRDAVGLDRDLPGGRRTSDHDRADLQNAFAEGRLLVRGTSVSARVGRQEMLLGRERLVGPADWSNARRAFEGTRVMLARGATTLDVVLFRPVLVRSSAGNRADSATALRGLVLGRRGGALRSWQGYVLHFEQDSIQFAGVAGSHRRVTVGARADGALPRLGPVAFGWDAEGALQRGTLGSERIHAWFGVGELTGRLPDLPWRPSLSAGVELASGDAAVGDGRAGTFHQLFPSAHSHGGQADVIGRQNARELRLSAAATPVAPLAVRLSAHRFDRFRASDAVYGKSGAPLRTGDAATNDLGTEIDLSATWQLGRHLRLLAGAAHFAPGRWFDASTGGAHPIDWGYAGTTFTF